MIVKDPEDCTSMAEVRAAVDNLDRQIVPLLARRFGYMDAAARIKTERADVRDEQRKAAVLEKVQALAAELRLEPACVAEVYEHLIETSIAYELRSFNAAKGLS